MTFAQLAEYFHKIEETSSRLTITEIVAELFRDLTPEESRQVSYLLMGRIAPLYDGKEFGMGAKLVDQATIKGLSIDPKEYMQKRSQLGDGGLTAQWYKREQGHKPSNLSIGEVYSCLKRLTTLSGGQSQIQKIGQLADLIKEVGPLEARYLARIPANTLRLGFSDMTLLDAYSWMLAGNKSLRAEIEKAYHVSPDLGAIAFQLKKEGIKGLAHCIPQAGVPILMMKAERTSSPSDALGKLTEALIESKYDGFRLQIHKKGSLVRLFSRGLEDVTQMYPDIVKGVHDEIKVHTIIFEGEALGYNNKTNTFLPFQETSQRKRKV
ncbi:MAG: DNA ligase [Microgenomates bacterium OLB22]|nr:MAG: DNA ligase [Microgenomates bacterium OLB22]